MKAVVGHGKQQLSVDEVDDPGSDLVGDEPIRDRRGATIEVVPAP